VPVTVEAAVIEWLPGPVESAAYLVVSEALANVAEYSQATHAKVTVEQVNGHVTVEVADDGVGGADATNGSRQCELSGRIAALDGELSVDSPTGRGTALRAEIPVPDHGQA
jgi:signal transduction histidine kinase